MSPYLSVRQFGPVARQHRATIASLPAALRCIDAGAADIVVTTPDLATVEAALAAAGKAIVITDPVAIGDEASRRLAEARVAVFPALLLTPSLGQLDAASSLAGAGLIHSRLNWHGDMTAAIFEHIAGLSSVVGALSEVELRAGAGQGYVGSARATSGGAVLWSGTAGSALPSYELDIVGLGERLEVRADLDGSARPFVLRRAHAGGQEQPVGIYETGLRLFWRGVVDALSGGKVMPHWSDILEYRDLAARLVAHQPRSISGAASAAG